jgi:plasmid stabilization system protein ParE
MSSYILSKLAQRQLEEIFDYTLVNHGERQLTKYQVQLEKCFASLINSGRTPRRLKKIDHGLRMLHCQHYYIFGIVLGDVVQIVAIYHEKMDVFSHLKGVFSQEPSTEISENKH